MEISRRQRTAAAAILLAGTGACLSWISWRKWSEPYVDYGFQLYVPWQMNEGQVLYRDIPFLYGPFSQHLNALLFKIFGMHAMTLIAFNHFVTAVQTGLIFLVLRDIFDELAGFVCAGLFLCIFAFAQYNDHANHNFITPYAHEAVHASVLAWAGLYALLRFLKNGKMAPIFWTGLCTGAVLMTKVETLLAVSAAGAAGLCGWALAERPDRASVLRTAGVCAAGLFLFPAVFFLLYCRWLPPVQAVEAIFSHLWAPLRGGVASDPVFVWFRGTDDLGQNLSLLGSSAFAQILWVAGIVLACGLLHRFGDPERRPWGVRTFWALSIFAVAASYFQVRWVTVFRPLALYLPIFCAALIWASLRPSAEPRTILKNSARLAVAVFAWLMTLKIALKVEIFYYGFVLAMPAALLGIGAAIYGLPRILSRRFGDCRYLTPVLAACALTCGVWHVNQFRSIYAFKTFPLGPDPDWLYDFTPRKDFREKLLQRTAEKLDELKKPGQSLAVFPAGIILNYWTRMPSPTHLYNYNPANLSATGEAQAQERLMKNPPDWIVLYDSDASFGRGPRIRFGTDYALPVMEWIQSHYTPEFQAAPPDRSTYGMVILRRIRSDS